MLDQHAADAGPLGGRPVQAERAGLPHVGYGLRERRLSLDVSLRELARRLSLSPSLISQIERGRVMPSVATLYAITTELNMSLDALFRDTDGQVTSTQQLPGAEAAQPSASGPSDAAAASAEPVVRPAERKVIELGSGVRWERLTRSPDHGVDFLYVVYEPGGASCDPPFLIRHAGREYGHVLSGRLEVTVGFESRVLDPGDSISFDSTTPHRLAAVGEKSARAVWFVVGRLGDSRFG